MLDKEIYSYLNTLDNLKALLKAKQRGISTDGQKNWCYKDGSNQLHVGADQKYWNGSEWVYASNEFGATTFYGNLALGANTISRDGAANKGFGVSESGVPTVYGDLVVDNNLKVAGLTASQIVETDANKKLISVAKGTAYNANFGTGSNDVCRGNDPRLSDARVPINNDYYVQGTNNRRMILSNSTRPLASTEYCTFFRMDNTDPSFDSRLTGGVGLGFKVINNSGPYSFELMGQASGNGVLLFGGADHDGVRYPWRSIWHSGNFNPADYQSAITGTANKVLSIQADGTGVKTGSIYDDGNVVLIGKTTATGGYKFEVEGNTLVNADKLVVYNAEETDTFIQVANGFTGLGQGTGLIIGVEFDGHSVLKVDQGSYLKFQSDDSGPIDMATLQYNGTTLFNVNGKIQGRQLVVYNAGATDSFIQVTNGVTGTEEGLIIGVEADGDAVFRVDYLRYLRFQCESMYGPKDMVTLRYGGTTEVNVNGTIQCDGFRLDRDPYTGTITPDKYIIINCNGTDYKIPVVKA